MRTTLDLNDQLLREAKKQAAQRGRSLTSYIEDALRLALANVPRRAKKVRLRISKKGLRLKTGINFDDTSALLDRLEQHDAHH